MKVFFSRHARRQMKWRKISEDEILSAINDPAGLEDSIKGRKNAFKVVGDRSLKVTFKRDGESLTVVTAVVKGE